MTVFISNNLLNFKIMGKFKLLLLIVLLFSVSSIHGQYSEKWNVDVDFSYGPYYIGCENMDNDNNKEIVTFSYHTGVGNSIHIIDGVTGEVEFSSLCSGLDETSINLLGYPKLIDIDNDGKYELLFYGKLPSSDSWGVKLLSFHSSSAMSQVKSKNSTKIENYPNPFNESTTIRYNVPTNSIVRITLYDLNGRLLKTILNEQKNTGDYELNFKSENLQSGTFLYQVQVGEFIDAQKMVIIK